MRRRPHKLRRGLRAVIGELDRVAVADEIAEFYYICEKYDIR